MKIAVLLGYSTAGKSTILRDFKKAYADKLHTVDTDALIAKAHNNHIYNVFLALSNDEDTEPALKYIEDEENRILNDLANGNGNTPCLVAAGPALPTRTKWNTFWSARTPTCFYLTLSAKDVYDGLVKRHERHKLEIGGQKNFGCWDKASSKKFVEGKWKLMEFAEAESYIKANMTGCMAAYEGATAPSRRYSAKQIQTTKDKRKKLYKAIAKSLGLNPGPVLTAIEES